MNAPAVQYAQTEDGYSIAFTVQGDGPPLLCLPFAFSHAQAVWTSSSATSFLQKLSEHFRVVYYDGRGQGLSQRGLPPETSLDSLLLDLRAVIEKLRLNRPTIFASTFSAHVAVNFAHRSREQAATLVLMHCPVSFAGNVAWTRSLVNQSWDFFLRMQVGLAAPMDTEETQRMLNRVEGLKARTTAADYLTMIGIFAASDLTELLPTIETPTLVLHATGQNLVEQEESARLAALLHNGRLAALGGPEFFGNPDQTLAAIESLLAESASSDSAAGPAHTLSAREVEVLRLLAAGNSNQQIADELVISLNTVNRHVSNIYAKAGAANRAQAAIYARDHGIT
jgi:DNA-binding CsgD family transcriptional regulator/pimeloyl-ACP methyl ester carboxylesterase